MGVVIATTCARCGRAEDAGAGLCAACDERAPLRYYAEYARRYAARDLDAFIDLFDDGWTMVLHSVGAAAETIDLATCRAWTASVYAVSPDARFTIDEVLACDQRVLAMRASYHGHGPGGRGEFAYVAGFVTVVEGGHSLRTEQFEYDDDAAMLARYSTLTRG
jgi:hypothetical protein